MIKYLQIENFKSLKKTALPMARLNLFFGMNGMGKSSVIQALLLLRQSYWNWKVKGLHGLTINGDLAQLGTSADIFCQNADEEYIRFVIKFEQNEMVDVVYDYHGNSMPTGVLKIRNLAQVAMPFADGEALFGNGFCYLGADHIGPKMGYSAVQWVRTGINPFGAHGEYAVPFLAQEGNNFKVPKELCLEGGRTDRLFDQVSAWMAEISPGIKISATYSPFEELAKLQISFSGQRIESSAFLPVNVGFGIPYVLPLVIELLTSKNDGLIIIENPESHLHPRGQSRMAELIARVANRGTQIICESHSDHIINGVRVAIKEKQLSCDDLSVVYFSKDSDQVTKICEIAVDPNGNLSEYPKGLLDEWGSQMALLI